MKASRALRASSRWMRARSDASNAARRSLIRCISEIDGGGVPNGETMYAIGIDSTLLFTSFGDLVVSFERVAEADSFAEDESTVGDEIGGEESAFRVIDSLIWSSCSGSCSALLEPNPKNSFTSSTTPFFSSFWTSHETNPATTSGNPSTGLRRIENFVVILEAAHPKISLSLVTESVKFLV